jgi:hypothetical protein
MWLGQMFLEGGRNFQSLAEYFRIITGNREESPI